MGHTIFIISFIYLNINTIIFLITSQRIYNDLHLVYYCIQTVQTLFDVKTHLKHSYSTFIWNKKLTLCLLSNIFTQST